MLAATLVLASAALFATSPLPPPAEFAWLGAAALALGAVGAVDDIRPLPAMLRLVLQTLAVIVVVVASGDTRILPQAAPWVEQGLLVIGGVWFVNLVNFMDGIDWITAAEMVPITAFIALLGAAGLLPLWAAAVGAALCGAMLGFAPFNKPAATLFLGDVGSLPIGLVVGWLLLKLAATGALAAAILLPLYYLADATVTLVAPSCSRRARVGGASAPLLPAGHRRERLHGDGGRRACLRAEPRPRGARPRRRSSGPTGRCRPARWRPAPRSWARCCGASRPREPGR